MLDELYDHVFGSKGLATGRLLQVLNGLIPEHIVFEVQAFDVKQCQQVSNSRQLK